MIKKKQIKQDKIFDKKYTYTLYPTLILQIDEEIDNEKQTTKCKQIVPKEKWHEEEIQRAVAYNELWHQKFPLLLAHGTANQLSLKFRIFFCYFSCRCSCFPFWPTSYSTYKTST